MFSCPASALSYIIIRMPFLYLHARTRHRYYDKASHHRKRAQYSVQLARSRRPILVRVSLKVNGQQHFTKIRSLLFFLQQT